MFPVWFRLQEVQNRAKLITSGDGNQNSVSFLSRGETRLRRDERDVSREMPSACPLVCSADCLGACVCQHLSNHRSRPVYLTVCDSIFQKRKKIPNHVQGPTQAVCGHWSAGSGLSLLCYGDLLPFDQLPGGEPRPSPAGVCAVAGRASSQPVADRLVALPCHCFKFTSVTSSFFKVG